MIRWIDEDCISSLKFTISMSKIIRHFSCSELETDRIYVMVRNKKGNLTPIYVIKFKIDIEDEMKALKSYYLREKGIKVNRHKLLKEATINICNKYEIAYSDNYLENIFRL